MLVGTLFYSVAEKSLARIPPPSPSISKKSKAGRRSCFDWRCSQVLHTNGRAIYSGLHQHYKIITF